jgi:Transglutaminase-like superfamily
MAILVVAAILKLTYFESFGRSDGFLALYTKVGNHKLSKKSPRSDALVRVCRAVNIATICYWKEVLCLQRSAATTCLLRSYGVAAQLVFGVQQNPFKAHAWVEVNGLVVNDRPYVSEMYTVVDRC